MMLNKFIVHNCVSTVSATRHIFNSLLHLPQMKLFLEILFPQSYIYLLNAFAALFSRKYAIWKIEKITHVISQNI